MFAYMLWHALTDIFSLSKCSQWCWALVLFQPDGFTSCFRPQESEGGTAQWNESCVALVWTGSQDFYWKNLEDGVELMSSDINQSDGHVQALTDRTGWNRMEPHDMKWCASIPQVSLMRRTRRSLTVKWVQWAIAGDFVTLVGVVGKNSVTGVASASQAFGVDLTFQD